GRNVSHGRAAGAVHAVVARRDANSDAVRCRRRSLRDPSVAVPHAADAPARRRPRLHTSGTRSAERTGLPALKFGPVPRVFYAKNCDAGEGRQAKRPSVRKNALIYVGSMLLPLGCELSSRREGKSCNARARNLYFCSLPLAVCGNSVTN